MTADVGPVGSAPAPAPAMGGASLSSPARETQRGEEGNAGGYAARQPSLHRLVTATCAPAVCLSDDDGQLRAEGVQGLYVGDVRVLSELVVSINGVEPVVVGLDLVGGCRSVFECVAFDVGKDAPDPALLVTREREVRADGLRECLAIESCSRETIAVRLAVRVASDMAPMAAVKSGGRPPAKSVEVEDGNLRWEAPGSGQVSVVCSPAPESVASTGATLTWDIVLHHGEQRSVCVEVVHREDRPGVVRARPTKVIGKGTPRTTAGYRSEIEQGLLGTMSVRSDDPRLERFVKRSLADLESLVMATASTPDDPFVAAGVPWFLTLFGRDSIWVARMLLPLGTGIALGTLRTLAHRQGAAVDEVTAEEPGKILHELRREPSSHEGFAGGRHGEAPLMLPPVYYGTVDATPLWVCLLRDAWRWGLSEDEVGSLLDPMERCLAWMRDYGMSVNGFLSYVDRSRSGLTNQGWKDSHDAIQYHSGRLARAPVCLCEAQGYAYEAAIAGAELLDAFGRPGGDEWREFGEVLAQRFRERFWVDSPRGPFPAIAIDGDGVAVDALASNIGHLLGTGILDSEESELVATWLGRPDLDSGFGLRTLSASSAGFNPFGYHTGSVWAHDTAIAIAGLSATPGNAARQCASSFIDGVLAAAEGFEFRMPELYGGQSRDGRPAPPAYPASCRPQAWSAASAIAVVSTLAGLRPDVPAGRALLRPLSTAKALEVSGMRVDGEALCVRIRPGVTPEVDGLPARLDLEV